MLLGYNTNGLAHHDLFEGINLLAETGYRSVAITIDHSALAPKTTAPQEVRRLRKFLDQLEMRSVIETGARFLLDPKQKHEPTLVSADADLRTKRIDFYKYAIRCASEMGSNCVSIWSGTVRDRITPKRAMERLVEGLRPVLDYAAGQGVLIGLEPEPGMLIDSIAKYDELLDLINAPNLRLTLDLGHLECQQELPMVNFIRRWGRRIVNVHLSDMRAGTHEHMMLGEGDVDFAAALQGLVDVGYQGGLHVELNRHSHNAPEVVKQAFNFLKPIMKKLKKPHA